MEVGIEKGVNDKFVMELNHGVSAVVYTVVSDHTEAAGVGDHIHEHVHVAHFVVQLEFFHLGHVEVGALVEIL